MAGRAGDLDFTPHRTGTLRKPWSMDRGTGVAYPSLVQGVYTCFRTRWGWDWDWDINFCTDDVNECLYSQSEGSGGCVTCLLP
jgi:hypothetical protein